MFWQRAQRRMRVVWLFQVFKLEDRGAAELFEFLVGVLCADRVSLVTSRGE
jgi:hypothetical protein